MKIVSYNIQFGLGKDGCNDLYRIAREVDGADIIALQEVERNWQHSGQVDQPEALAALLDRYYWVYGPYFDVDASVKNPDGTITNIRRQFGNMILSKQPIVSTRLFPFPKSNIKDQRSMAKGLLEGVIDLGENRALRVYCVHLSAKSAGDRISQIHFTRRIIAQAPSEGGAWTGANTHPLWREDEIEPPMPREFVLMGDFNHTPLDAEYAHLVSSETGECNLTDCWTLTGHLLEDGITFPTLETDNCKRIDFAFVDQTMSKCIKAAWIDTDTQGSDHQPIWIEADELSAG